MSLNNEPCITRPTFIDINFIDISCNVTDDLSRKICILSKTKDKNVKVFNLMTKIKEVKTLIKHISCYCKCRFNSAPCNSSHKRNNNKV